MRLKIHAPRALRARRPGPALPSLLANARNIEWGRILGTVTKSCDLDYVQLEVSIGTASWEALLLSTSNLLPQNAVETSHYSSFSTLHYLCPHISKVFGLGANS